MLHSIAYLISGLMLFSFSLLPSGEITSEQVGRDQGQGYGQGIHGKVVDADSQEPIANATVTIKGTNVSTETDQDGSFYLSQMGTPGQQGDQDWRQDRDQEDADRTDRPDQQQTQQQYQHQGELTLVVSADGYEETEEDISGHTQGQERGQQEELTIELQRND